MLSLGKETTVEALGRTWRLGRLELRVIREFRDWIAAKVGDPFAKVERVLKFLDKEEGLKRIKEAESIADQLEGFSLQCPLAIQYRQTEEGMAILFRGMLRQHHPDVTDEQAFAVLQAAGEKSQGIVADAQGNLPNAGQPGTAATQSPA